jgi:D-alanine transaminase
MSRAYLNGQYLPLEEVTVSVMDRGFLFGDGVYEVIPVYRGRPFRLEQHLDRLERSLGAIRLDSPLSREAWRQVLERLIGAQPERDQLVYVQITRGPQPSRNHLFPEAATPTVFATAWEAKPRNPDIAVKGITAITMADVRWLRCDIKSIALLSNVLLRQAAQDAGAEEAILIRDGQVTEGSSTNVILIKEGEVITPAKGNLLLSGITRDLILELAREAGIPSTERAVAAAELRAADELWVVSSSREVAPVTRLDGIPLGAGTPGPLWRRMDRLFQEYKARPTPPA